MVLDAELVVLDEGRCDFDVSCGRLRSAAGPAVTVFAFDVLALDGADLRDRPSWSAARPSSAWCGRVIPSCGSSTPTRATPR